MSARADDATIEERIRVAIVDDHPVVRDGTAALLAAQAGFEVPWTAGSLEQARANVRTPAGTDPGTEPDADCGIDVILLDIRLGAASGLALLTDAATGPRPAVIVLTAYDYPQYADAAFELGAAGFVLKTAPFAELLDAIRRVAAGGLAFHVRPGRAVHLSPRELDVVRLVVEGRSNDEIGTALGIGAKTVETHLARLFERLTVASRTELASRALREGWLERPV